MWCYHNLSAGVAEKPWQNAGLLSKSSLPGLCGWIPNARSLQQSGEDLIPTTKKETQHLWKFWEIGGNRCLTWAFSLIFYAGSLQMHMLSVGPDQLWCARSTSVASASVSIPLGYSLWSFLLIAGLLHWECACAVLLHWLLTPQVLKALALTPQL